MSNCKYTITKTNGEPLLEVPSFSTDANNADFKKAFINQLMTEGINPEDLLLQLDTTTKQLVVPEEMMGFVMGQNSLKGILYNVKDQGIKDKLGHVNRVLANNWKNTPMVERGKNPTSTQNIVFAAFDESIDYEYNQDTDVIYINSIDGINYESVLKASLERAAYLLAGGNKEQLLNLKPDVMKALDINAESDIQPDDVYHLYFNDTSNKKGKLDNYVGDKQASHIEVRDTYEELAYTENRDDNYEPVNKELVQNLKSGDLVFKSHEKGASYSAINEKFSPSDGSYSLFVDYSINKDGKYVIKVLAPNSDFAEKLN